MTTATHTTHTAVKHVLLAIRNGQPEIVSVHTQWSDAISAWQTADDARLAAGTAPRELHYAVRDADHELVQAAAAAVVAKLGKAQRQALGALAKATRPGQSIKPGNRKVGSTDGRRWGQAGGQADTAGVAAPMRAAAKHGLVIIGGLDYAPKTYTLTAKGRIVAAAI
jgi:hypothetical protein